MAKMQMMFGVMMLSILTGRFTFVGDFARRLIRIPSQYVPNENKNSNAVRFGMLGTAGIAKFALIWPSYKSDDVVVFGVASRDVDRATLHAEKFDIPNVYQSYDQLINAPEIDAVYISLPSRMHYVWVQKCIQAGKDVLVEKPITLSADETLEIHRLAAQRGVVVMEGYHYRYHPVAQRLQQLIEFGAFGQIHNVSIDFSMLNIGYLLSNTLQPQQSTAPSDAEDLAESQQKERDHNRVKMFDRWCYCVDILTMMFHAEVLTATVTSANITHGSFSAQLILASSQGDGTTPIHVQLEASRETVEIPKWGVRVKGSQGTTSIKNIGFPFLWHSIENGTSMTSEKHYGDGGSTFEYQLRAFVAEVTGQRRSDAFMKHSVATMELVKQILTIADQPPL